MKRTAGVAAAVVAAFFAGTSSASVDVTSTLQVTAQAPMPGGHMNGLRFSGSGVVRGVGKVLVSGTESEGCPYFWSCGKGFELTLATPSGDTLQIDADWSEECEAVLVDGQWRGETFCPGQISNQLVPMPTDIPITHVTGTGRFATTAVVGLVAWSASTEYPDFRSAYPAAPGTAITIYLSGVLDRR